MMVFNGGAIGVKSVLSRQKQRAYRDFDDTGGKLGMF